MNIFRKIYYCIIALFFLLITSFIGCAHHKKPTTVPETTNNSRSSHQITLMPHQEYTINYLNTHPEIKGLLINHYMGTGKTFLSIGYAEQHQSDSIVILGPSYLKNNWTQQLKAFPVKNSGRYQFISFDDAIKRDSAKLFSNKILIIDEAHNFIKYLNSENEKQNEKYARLLQNTRTAKRILGLTGTPIYQDVSDIALMLNLVSQEDLITYGRERFRTNYTQKIPERKFWRGHLFESNIFYLSLPVFCSFLSFALFATPLAIIPGAAIGAAIVPLANNAIAPLTHYQLRKGDYEALYPHIQKYVSYFRFENPPTEDFPLKTVHERKVPFSTAQMKFFLDYIEEDLTTAELSELVKELHPDVNPTTLSINSSRINKNLKRIPGNGREIGNLSLPGPTDEPPKFVSLLEEIKRSPGKVAIFSNYFYNGIEKFYAYLVAKGLGDQAVLISPHDSDAVQASKISAYNNDKKQIILFNFVEGVSLFKTRQLHVLEPVLNAAILEQVIGRAVRYRSHAALKEEERHVDVFLWQSTLPQWDWDSYQLKRANWRLRYGELNQYSNWGQGITQLDKNYDQKLFSPDEATTMSLEKLQRDSQEMLDALREHSIENFMEK